MLASEARPLPLANRLLYASGSLGSQVLSQALTVWIFFYYVSPSARADGEALAPVYLVGLVLAIGRVFDAVTDPIIGYWSDITRSRWGRRVPFVVIGSPLMAIAFVLLWTPPVDGFHWVNAIYLGAMLQVYFLLMTVVGAPYTGIFPELARTKEDRVSVSAWQLVFGLIGAGFALIATGPLVDQAGFFIMGLVVAVLGVGPRYLGLLGARGRLHYQPPATHRAEFLRAMLRAFRLTLANRNFLALVASLVCFQAGLLMMTQAIPFYVTEVLQLSKSMQAPVTAAFFIAALAAIPIVIRFTRHRDKRDVYFWCLAGATVTLPLLFFAGFVEGIPSLVQVLLVLAVIGVPLSGIFILPDALLADVVDEDQLRTDSRREAMFFSSRSTLEKMAQAVATGLFAVLLGYFGQTAEEPTGIRLIGPVAAVATLAGWLIFAKAYRIREPAPAAGGVEPAEPPEPTGAVRR